MKLVFSGRAVNYKHGDDGKKHLTIEPVKDDTDLMALLPFHKHECDLRALGTKQDFRTHGYLEEWNIKNKLKLKFMCTDSAEKIDLNVLSAIIDDPETTTIFFDDKLASLSDYDEVAARAKEANKELTERLTDAVDELTNDADKLIAAQKEQ